MDSSRGLTSVRMSERSNDIDAGNMMRISSFGDGLKELEGASLTTMPPPASHRPLLPPQGGRPSKEAASPDAARARVHSVARGKFALLGGIVPLLHRSAPRPAPHRDAPPSPLPRSAATIFDKDAPSFTKRPNPV